MPKGKYKNYSAQQKLKICMEALREDVTIKEICTKHKISKSTIHKWLQQLKDQGTRAFEINLSSDNSEIESLREELEQTRARLGELLVENDFLKKASSHIERRIK